MVKRLVLGILIGLMVGGLVAAGVVNGLHWLTFADAGSFGPTLAYALAAGTVLHAFDPAVSVSGDVINGRASLSIVRGCDASEVLVLLSAAVLAAGVYPWRLRVLGVLAGAAAVTMANIVRICSLYCVSVYFPSAFEACHLEIWPLGLIVLAVVFFVAWARWASTRTAAAR